jgi:heme A synthase
MLYDLAVILALLAAGIFCGTTWRGMKSSEAITNPFPELPDEAFRTCADFVKKRYAHMFFSSVAVCAAIIFIYLARIRPGLMFYLLGILGIFIALIFFGLATVERSKAEKILAEHNHHWFDLTHSIAAHRL